MDGDGEDRPSEIKDFVEYTEYSPNQTIVGERVNKDVTDRELGLLMAGVA